MNLISFRSESGLAPIVEILSFVVEIAPGPISQPTLKVENPPIAISPSTPNAPKPNTPSPNNIPLLHEVVPSNNPSTPPKNAIQWQKGMTAMYQGLDWVIGMLGTATAKIVRNGFELWVDIPDLAIA